MTFNECLAKMRDLIESKRITAFSLNYINFEGNYGAPADCDCLIIICIPGKKDAEGFKARTWERAFDNLFLYLTPEVITDEQAPIETTLAELPEATAEAAIIHDDDLAKAPEQSGK